MNPYTGEIKEDEGVPLGELLKIPTVTLEDRFVELPETLNRAARRALAQGRTHISLTSGGRLSRWASKVRREIEGSA